MAEKRRKEPSKKVTRERLRLVDYYRDSVRGQLQKQLGLKNVMEVPRLEKIVLNVGSKEAVADSKALQLVCDVLKGISGQAPVKTLARKSIAGFKIRSGMKIGACVTLRGDRMYAFFDKLVSIALPKVRDFQGVTTRFDGRGGYNLGIREWTIFPEAEAVAGDRMGGLNISIQTSSRIDDSSRALLAGLGMPFKK